MLQQQTTSIIAKNTGLQGCTKIHGGKNLRILTILDIKGCIFGVAKMIVLPIPSQYWAQCPPQKSRKNCMQQKLKNRRTDQLWCDTSLSNVFRVFLQPIDRFDALLRHHPTSNIWRELWQGKNPLARGNSCHRPRAPTNKQYTNKQHGGSPALQEGAAAIDRGHKLKQKNSAAAAGKSTRPPRAQAPQKRSRPWGGELSQQGGA